MALAENIYVVLPGPYYMFLIEFARVSLNFHDNETFMSQRQIVSSRVVNSIKLFLLVTYKLDYKARRI